MSAAAGASEDLDALRAQVTKQAGVVKIMKADGKPQVSQFVREKLPSERSCRQFRGNHHAS
jgi:hypothetical protein